MNQNNSGLLRFRSAPSSLFSNLPDKNIESIQGFLNHRDSSPDAQGLISNDLISQSFGDLTSGGDNDNNNKGLSKGYGLNSQLPPHYPRQSSTQIAAAIDGSFRVETNQVQTKIGPGLTRQNSSPAGLFSHLTSQNGYTTIRGVGNYNSSGDLNQSSNMLKCQLSFSPGIIPSSLGMLSRIAEIDGENVDQGSPDDEKLGNGSGPTQFYSTDYPFASSLNNSLHFVDSFSGLKRELEDDGKLFTSSQIGEVPTLSHHLSLPQTSIEMEKLMQFQDSVPCKIRAKRGCATHPRSIAERVRRTRISERMRKLQDLVPYMDKQTNTADMLDLAVEYIKDLQKQFKTLSDNRAKCRCSHMHKPIPN